MARNTAMRAASATVYRSYRRGIGQAAGMVSAAEAHDDGFRPGRAVEMLNEAADRLIETARSMRLLLGAR